MKLNFAFLQTAALLCVLTATNGLRAETILTGQGLLAGEVTESSAILHTRFTKAEALIQGDVPGTKAIACFEVADNEVFKNSIRTDWMEANRTNDYIVKAKVTGLKAGTQYYYRMWFGLHPKLAQTDVARAFKTLGGAASTNAVTFVVGGAMNYQAWSQGVPETQGPYAALDRLSGYSVFRTLYRLRPDFYVGLGNSVFYDDPADSPAQTEKDMRRKWHEQFVMHRLPQFFSFVPAYWLKNDRDYRFAHAGALSTGEPSHALATRIFREQLPVAAPGETNAVSHRTRRVNKYLQLWFVDARDHRSPNQQPDGPGKTIWGVEQTEWLKRTLKESDATFKILMTPTPMIGPIPSGDDTHAQPGGFQHERDAFLAWLQQSGISPAHFLIVCGGTGAWHSRNDGGFEEISCGVLHRGAAHPVVRPGDPASSDPEGRVTQVFGATGLGGSFLKVVSGPSSKGDGATLEVHIQNDLGSTLHTMTRDAAAP